MLNYIQSGCFLDEVRKNMLISRHQLMLKTPRWCEFVCSRPLWCSTAQAYFEHVKAANLTSRQDNFSEGLITGFGQILRMVVQIVQCLFK